jgi:probable rRNA maturation factor
MKLSENIDYQISISITGDARLLGLNKQYRGKASTTDVLSFSSSSIVAGGSDDQTAPQSDSSIPAGNFADSTQEVAPEKYLGDIYVNKDQASRQAKEHGHTLEQEISELVAHGVLHLLGVHHDGDDH